jgi:hypothetical protein
MWDPTSVVASKGLHAHASISYCRCRCTVSTMCLCVSSLGLQGGMLRCGYTPVNIYTKNSVFVHACGQDCQHLQLHLNFGSADLCRSTEGTVLADTSLVVTIAPRFYASIGVLARHWKAHSMLHVKLWQATDTNLHIHTPPTHILA